MEAFRPAARVIRTAQWICASRAVAALLAAVVLFFCVAAPTAQGETAGIDPALESKLRKRGDLTLRDMKLGQALFTISETWKVNLVVGENIEGQVNGVFKDAPLHEILDSILLANDYGWRPVGQSVIVAKLDTLGDANPMFQSTTITLKAAKPEDIIAAAALLNSPQGKLQAIPSAQSVLVLDFPDRVKQIRQFVERMDEAAARAAARAVVPVEPKDPEQLQMAYFAPQYVEAKSLAEAMQSILSEDGKVAAVEDENRLVVVDRAPALKLAAELVKQLDVPRRQVFGVGEQVDDIAEFDVDAFAETLFSVSAANHS